MIERLTKAGVKVHGCETTRELVPGTFGLAPDDFHKEYLDLEMNCRVVDGIDAALDHISRYGSNHTETIVTENHARAMKFLREADASAVMINASTRFNDGFEFGLGAEIGISTTKLHAYGPMGLEELTAQKFIVFGSGQLRK